MPSSLRLALGVTTVALTLAVPSVVEPAPIAEQAAPRASVPDSAEISKALDIVEADPNLSPKRTIKTLRWNSPGDQKKPVFLEWLNWIAGLFGWVGQSMRVLMWVALLGLAGALVVYLVRTLRSRRPSIDTESVVAPTHVRDLDIRPETLPPDIGLAARALWDANAHRAALALLYRGLLSRLTHVHRLPVRHSSTEGDCLALAARLPQERRDYASQLIGVWQRFVYGGEEIQTPVVHGLCNRFVPALDAAPSFESASRGATT